jgi:hypothetical protein
MRKTVVSSTDNRLSVSMIITSTLTPSEEDQRQGIPRKDGFEATDKRPSIFLPSFSATGDDKIWRAGVPHFSLALWLQTDGSDR